MLTYQDCLGMCDFSQDEINAIAHHEHISGMQAIGLAENLIHRRGGVVEIEQLLLDELETSIRRGDSEQVAALERVLMRFRNTHPDSIDLGID